MNRNQLLKEVNAFVKELNVNIDNICKLKKDELQVEYNRLMELKNAPTVAEIVEQPIKVSVPVAEVITDRAMSITEKLLSDWDCYEIRENAQKYLHELVLMVVGDCDEKIKSCISAESKAETIVEYFEKYIYNVKGNIDYIKNYVFADMKDEIINDDFYHFVKDEIIDILVDEDGKDDVEVVENVCVIEQVAPTAQQYIEVATDQVAPVYNMPTAADIEEVFQEVDQINTTTQNKPAYDYGIRYFDNYEVERDDDRDFGRWGDDDEPSYKRVRDTDDDRDFGRFHYYDKNYDKYDYNNNDTTVDDEDLMMNNDDGIDDNMAVNNGIDDDAAINNNEEVAQGPEEEEVDEVIVVENANNTVQLTLNDLPAPAVNINPIQSLTTELKNKNWGFNRLSINDKCNYKSSHNNMPLMSALSMDKNNRTYRHAILRDEQSNKFYLFESMTKCAMIIDLKKKSNTSMKSWYLTVIEEYSLILIEKSHSLLRKSYRFNKY